MVRIKVITAEASPPTRSTRAGRGQVIWGRLVQHIVVEPTINEPWLPGAGPSTALTAGHRLTNAGIAPCRPSWLLKSPMLVFQRGFSDGVIRRHAAA
ncbi:MAG: hypothetical protein ABIQ18_29650 [Umezawaea sp.]